MTKMMGADTARLPSRRLLKPGERNCSDRDMERKEKLNLRKLKTLTDEYEFLSNKFKGSRPKSVQNRLKRLEDVIKVKTAIYEEALKNA